MDGVPTSARAGKTDDGRREEEEEKEAEK